MIAAGGEWLEADALGGFASGPVAGARTRRYHALLLAATIPPTGRMVLVSGVEAFVTSGGREWPLSTQHYGPDVTWPRGVDHLVEFASEPWPRWTFHGEDGTVVVHEIVVERDSGTVLVSWQRIAGDGPATLRVRPLLAGRDYHALMHENGAFDLTPHEADGHVAWRPYDGVPTIVACASGTYRHAPDWYRNFRYAEETARGLDDREDLATPGEFTFDLARGEALLVLRADAAIDGDAHAVAQRIRTRERMLRAALTPLDRAAAQYVVRRDDGLTIVAGFPWFTDWGRDTFIAMRGLVLARGRYDEAQAILAAWAPAVSEGMLPNRFPDRGAAPEYNAVDASLWFVIVVHEFLAAVPGSPVRAALLAAAEAILAGYTKGTRHGIRMDDDALLACGAPGVQLTWMDAKVGERVITPRSGKPVEVQALWYNALRLAGGAHAQAAARVAPSFAARFVRRDGLGLHDVVDVDHVRGTVDASVRPNQIFTVGGLPFPLVAGSAARAVVDVVLRDLVTPAGLRTLAPGDPRYRGRYEGDPAQRDGAYHQGTAWPWLLGPFTDAWLRVHGDDVATRREARERFVAPLVAALAARGQGHLSEIADGDAPHAWRGCPFQAWSQGELIRMLAATAPR
ncbi:MAG: amylo-alpha-1,6-glucosidase [Burkholderiales bacterium]